MEGNGELGGIRLRPGLMGTMGSNLDKLGGKGKGHEGLSTFAGFSSVPTPISQKCWGQGWFMGFALKSMKVYKSWCGVW